MRKNDEVTVALNKILEAYYFFLDTDDRKAIYFCNAYDQFKSDVIGMKGEINKIANLATKEIKENAE